MAPPDQPYDDRFLAQYLLGALPADDADIVDVLCISDEDMAARLAAIENDLVDAYVRGDLSPEDLGAFKSFYMASPHRRQKVEFAAALLAVEKKRAATPVAAPVEEPVAAPVVAPVAALPAVVSPTKPKPVFEFAPEPKPPARRPAFHWGFALAAAAVIALAVYTSLDNLRLRRLIRNGETEHAIVDQTRQQLQKDLDAARAANAESAKEIERLRQSQSNVEQLKIVSVLLPPPTRGLARPPAVAIQPGTDVAVLTLILEADEFPQYRAALRDPGAGQVLWSSGDLRPSSLGEKKVLSLSLPAGLLKQQNYLVELTGLPVRGGPEILGAYPFHAVLK